MIILTACDKAYWKHARALIGSIARNTPHDVRFRLVDGSNMYSPIPAFVSNYRLYMLEQAMAHFDSALWLDADTIVRASLEPLAEMMKGGFKEMYDVLAVKTPEFEQEENQWLISTVGIAATRGGKIFLERWRYHQAMIECQAEHDQTIMDIQLSFVRAVKELEGNVRIKDIGYDWSDKFMREESPIWEFQGNRKDDPRAIAEQEKYR